MKIPEQMKMILADDDPEHSLAALDSVLGADTKSTPRGKLLRSVYARLIAERVDLRKQMAKSGIEIEKARQRLEKIKQPPLFPGLVVRIGRGERFEVVVAGRRQIVVAHPDLEGVTIDPGDSVLLDHEMAVIVERVGRAEGAGLVGVVRQVADDRVIVSGTGDEEIAALCAPEIAAGLEPGDRVAYSREIPCVFDKLPARDESRFALGEKPRVRFEDIGGLDELTEQIRTDLDLHIIHRDRVAGFGLRLMRGLLLEGRPGVGKTMIAEAIASHLSAVSPESCFLSVPPGSLRAPYYGQTEERIRELFETARAAPGLVVIFFDELDTFGTRGAGVGNEIDSRVLTAFLAAMQGLDSAADVFCVAATNRMDLCDAALIRDGRFGDRIYRVPRPNREATREVLARHLRAGLSYGSGPDEAEATRLGILDAVSSYLHAERGGAEPLATVTFANGSERVVRAADVLSGALIEGAVGRAKHAAAKRWLDGGDAIGLGDLLEAVDGSLETESRKLATPQTARQILDFPDADEIVRVDRPSRRGPARHRYTHAA